ncbi:MBL fold metallo-hydrolase RNA specificity domain-containing protein [Thalassoroseus pseudoceratinae]|uniref:MBL fold metallo-hydrolase RNA specificity domain-containing protein n=1 Tax=Thalassoroseus pseudoceratinae TaxID=2713176 RepID=UPI00142458D2|nr:MBL fold metallo-hydrolase [Thalassoroseus pseudoceratinae]
MQFTSFGAAGEVTGSQHLIETESVRLLLDCGLFQGERAETYAKNAHFHFEPKKLDGVILSHGHIDHCGNLPRLVKQGFAGPIFCTPATADVAEVMLLDSVHIQHEDAAYLAESLGPDAPPIEPLYTEADVRAACERFETLEPGDWHRVGKPLQIRFQHAGHILGAAITELEIEDDRELRRVVFTGDLGRCGMPLLPDPQQVDACDVLIVESTYANTVHPPLADLKDRLAKIVHQATERNGRVIVPAFSLGRTQTLLAIWRELQESGRLPEMPLYIDSPLAHRLETVYERHPDAVKSPDTSIFADLPNVHTIRTQRDSMALNSRQEPFVVVAASGMCEHGRIRHHLLHALPNENNTIVLIGFQARNTLGRSLSEGAKTVSILGYETPVRADVEVLSGLSAHADAEDLRWWFRSMTETGGVGQAFIVHGEPQAATALAAQIRDDCNEDPIIPEWRETYTT